MNDMRAVIVPKSDQLNADHLLAGPITITISNVTIRAGQEQPVSVHYDGDNGKPYKPCKSMARVMVYCWGDDANKYIGRSMTLYCDPKVKWGGLPVGGIRISNMTDINGNVTMALTEAKGSKKPFTVKPLIMPKQSPNSDALLLDANMAAAKGVDSYRAFWTGLTNPQRDQLLPQHEGLKEKAAAADAEAAATVGDGDPFSGSTSTENIQTDDDIFPGDLPNKGSI